MKYNVGNRVRIKSLDWYNENKDEDGNVVCFYSYFDKGMSEFCNKIVTIKALHGCHNVKAFRIIEDDGYSWWSDDMIEGLVEEETKPDPKFKVGDRVKWYNHTCDIASIDTSENTHKYLISNFDYREDKVFAKWVPESELTFDGDEETSTKLTGEVIKNNEMAIGVDMTGVIEEVKKCEEIFGVPAVIFMMMHDIKELGL